MAAPKGTPSKVCKLKDTPSQQYQTVQPGQEYFLKRRGRNTSRLTTLADPHGEGELVKTPDLDLTTLRDYITRDDAVKDGQENAAPTDQGNKTPEEPKTPEAQPEPATPEPTPEPEPQAEANTVATVAK